MESPSGHRRRKDSDEVFLDNEQPETSKAPRRTPTATRRSPRDLDHRSRSFERRASHRSSRKSQGSESELHGCLTKTDLIRASAKRAEQKRKLSEEATDRHNHRKSASVSTANPRKSPISPGRRQSVAVAEHQRSKSDTYSPKRSLSSSPKHKPISATNSKSSLLGKQSSQPGSPFRGYAGLIDASPRGAASRLLLPQYGSSGYSKPAMEVAVAALVFGAGVVTLIISLIIGSSAWMIVGGISMGIGGVFIAFGACFYISRHNKPLAGGGEELVEVRIIDQKQLAELSDDGFRVSSAVDL